MAEKKGKDGKAEAETEPAAPAYAARKKPRLTPEQRAALRLRRRISDRRPRFLRQEWFRHPRLGLVWRKPQGDHSKLRTHWRYRINVVSIGYRGPASVRGLHPSGFREVLVYTPKQLEGLNAERDAVRIGSGVGLRKRGRILEAADEKGLRVLNGGVGR
jgi:large subunit ribosomal protein L32e